MASSPSPSSPPLPLPPSITSRIITTSSLSIHILEAGYTPARDRPLILLFHGFPEIAYSWRKVIPQLASQGYYVVAPDQRGFGRTTGWDTRPFDETDLSTFSLSSLVRDAVTLVNALGYRSVRCVVGHDCGAVTAAMCALVRPDLFQSLLLLSHPFNGTPSLPFNTANPSPTSRTKNKGGGAGTESSAGDHIHASLASLSRKHYKWYYSTAPANNDMANPPQGLHTFLRGYFHLKSGSWSNNNPHPLTSWTAPQLAQMPYYYVMPLDATMPQAVAIDMARESPESQQVSHAWLPDHELAVYVAEYARTGFQGGLNWYRVRTAKGGKYTWDYEVWAGRTIDVPCAFVSGKSDWGIYQEPEALKKMEDGSVCTDFRFMRLIDGVGHWAPQENPNEVAKAILELVGGL